MKYTLLTLALVATAGAAQAQPMSQPQPMTQPMSQPMTQQPSSEPVDAGGRPYIGRNDWVRQPGDRASGSVGANTRSNVGGSAGAYSSSDMAAAPSGPREATFKDEFGFRYDAQGNRLDARGNIISPQTR